MKKRDKTIIWLTYFDSTISRRKGRKVPLSLAVKKVRINEVVNALEKLNLEYEVEPSKKHPATWFEQSGRVLVKKHPTLSKNKLVKIIAKKIRELREAK